jgi:hypothetical protein
MVEKLEIKTSDFEKLITLLLDCGNDADSAIQREISVALGNSMINGK